MRTFDYKGIVGISRRSIAENISKLKEVGILKRIGTDRKGHWEIVNNTNKEDE
jgi:predicted HTH transcriptional regulator